MGEVRKLGVDDIHYGADTTSVGGVTIKGVQPIDVRFYGAVGDGTTDDTAAVQAAFDAAVSTTKFSPIYFPPGTYKITSTLNIVDKVGVIIRGSGHMHSVLSGEDITGGPILNIRGTRLTMSDMRFTVDNCKSALWAYRTDTQPGGDLRFYNCRFDGTPTVCMLYMLGQEVNLYTNCDIITQSDVPGYVSCGTDILSQSPTGLAAGEQSNTVTHFKGGNIWAYAEVSSGSITAASVSVQIYAGGDHTFDNVYFYADSPGDHIQAGNSAGLTLPYEVAVRHCRFEGDGYPLHITSNVGSITFVGNSCWSATNPIYADDNTTVTTSYIMGNQDYVTPGTNTYYFYNLQRCTIFAPQANISVYNAEDCTLHIYAATYRHPTYPQSRTSEVVLYASGADKEYQYWKAQTIVPYYAYEGLLVRPDGSTWDPAGFGPRLAISTERGDSAQGWYQLVVGTTTAPGSAAADGEPGIISFDASYLYVCIGTGSWKRIAWDAW